MELEAYSDLFVSDIFDRLDSINGKGGLIETTDTGFIRFDDIEYLAFETLKKLETVSFSHVEPFSHEGVPEHGMGLNESTATTPPKHKSAKKRDFSFTIDPISDESEDSSPQPSFDSQFSHKKIVEHDSATKIDTFASQDSGERTKFPRLATVTNASSKAKKNYHRLKDSKASLSHRGKRAPVKYTINCNCPVKCSSLYINIALRYLKENHPNLDPKSDMTAAVEQGKLEDYDFICELCPFLTTKKEYLQAHMKYIHNH